MTPPVTGLQRFAGHELRVANDELQIRQAGLVVQEKLAALDELVPGDAYEISNPEWARAGRATSSRGRNRRAG